MSSGCLNCAAVSLPGAILEVCGCNGGAVRHTTEALSLETMIFVAGPTMRTPRQSCVALALPQGLSPRRAPVMGGRDGNSDQSTTEVLAAAG